MLCFLCGKKIGLLRALGDQQYCCSAHREEARLATSQALRDEDDVELWAVSKKKKHPERPGQTARQTASMFAFFIVGALLVAAMMMPGPGPGTAFPPVSLDRQSKRGMMERAGDAVSGVIRAP